MMIMMMGTTTMPTMRTMQSPLQFVEADFSPPFPRPKYAGHPPAIVNVFL
jgi:hypothetical protein